MHWQHSAKPKTALHFITLYFNFTPDQGRTKLDIFTLTNSSSSYTMIRPIHTLTYDRTSSTELSWERLIIISHSTNYNPLQRRTSFLEKSPDWYKTPTEPFSTNHLTDIDKTRHSYNWQQHKNPKQPARKLTTYAQHNLTETMV